MSKTVEELSELKREVDVLDTKLQELSAEEVKQVVGGARSKGTIIVGLKAVTPSDIMNPDKNLALDDSKHIF